MLLQAADACFSSGEKSIYIFLFFLGPQRFLVNQDLACCCCFFVNQALLCLHKTDCVGSGCNFLDIFRHTNEFAVRVHDTVATEVLSALFDDETELFLYACVCCRHFRQCLTLSVNCFVFPCYLSTHCLFTFFLCSCSCFLCRLNCRMSRRPILAFFAFFFYV